MFHTTKSYACIYMYNSKEIAISYNTYTCYISLNYESIQLENKSSNKMSLKSSWKAGCLHQTIFIYFNNNKNSTHSMDLTVSAVTSALNQG